MNETTAYHVIHALNVSVDALIELSRHDADAAHTASTAQLQNLGALRDQLPELDGSLAELANKLHRMRFDLAMTAPSDPVRLAHISSRLS